MTSQLLRTLALLTVTAMLCATGCSAPATVKFVSLHASEIDPPSTDILSFDAQEAYWWNDDGEINIAIRGRKHNLLLGKYGKSEVMISLVPGPPPAGRARNYRIAGHESRIVVRSLLTMQRLAANAGILGITFDGDVMRGSYRIWVSEQPQMSLFEFLPRSPGALLCFGTFKATRCQERGQAIRTASEENGWGRLPHTPKPASRPAPAP